MLFLKGSAQQNWDRKLSSGQENKVDVLSTPTLLCFEPILQPFPYHMAISFYVNTSDGILWAPARE